MLGTIADSGRPCNKLLPDIDECVLLLSAEVLDPALGLSGAQSLLYQEIPGIKKHFLLLKGLQTSFLLRVYILENSYHPLPPPPSKMILKGSVLQDFLVPFLGMYSLYKNL